MKRRAVIPTARGRRGYVTVVVLLMTGVLLMLAYLTGRLAFESFRRERQAHLQAFAEQALLSARAWSELNAAALTESPAEVALDEIVPAGVEARMTLSLIPAPDGDRRLVRCHLRLTRGGSSLKRDAHWPARAGVSPPAAPPASQPAP